MDLMAAVLGHPHLAAHSAADSLVAAQALVSHGVIAPARAGQPSVAHAIAHGIDATFVVNTDPSNDLPTGVLTPLASCYSPGCSPDTLCYSYACPRRSASSPNLRSHSLGHLAKRTISLHTSPARSLSLPSPSPLGSNAAASQPIAALWSSTVSPEILASVSVQERKRQEVIFELINSEREYVRDLESIIKVFMEPINAGGIIPDDRRPRFIRTVFHNIAELHRTNTVLLRKLVALQQENAVVSSGIGSAFLDLAMMFETYIDYGSQQSLAKALVAEEKTQCPDFVQFLEQCRLRPELRKLPLESFLASPTTRFARYPLLLKEIVKHMPDDSTEKNQILEAISRMQYLLTQLNLEAGRAENMVRLNAISRVLVQPEATGDTLRLLDPDRKIIREGKLTLRRQNGDIEATVFLFDNMLVAAKEKENGTLKVVKRAIPLELVVIKKELYNLGVTSNPSIVSLETVSQQSPAKGIQGIDRQKARPSDAPKSLSITIGHYGKDGSQLSLQAANVAELNSWIDAIERQKAERRSRLVPITSVMIWRSPSTSEYADMGPSTSLVWQGRLVVGGYTGVHVRTSVTDFTRIIDIRRVSKIDVQEDSRQLLVLADKTLYTYPIEILLGGSAAAIQKGRKVSSSVSFFKQGVLADQSIICTVDSKPLNSYIKIWRPKAAENSARTPFGMLFGSGQDALRPYKELYVPTETRSIDYLNTMLCVGSVKGFDVIQMSSLKTQSLLDESDEQLKFVLARETQSPVGVFRMRDGSFLLCYQEYSFFVDKFGRRIRPNWIVHWHGAPTEFAVVAGFLIAFDPSFVEVRDLLSGSLVQVILAGDLLVSTEREHVPSSASSTTSSVLNTTSASILSSSAAAQPATPVAFIRVMNTNPELLHLAVGLGGVTRIISLGRSQAR
ncbi:hypothetical protein BC831DRAFT_439680 [Entophlyctis helioformis]|nr:hypothetical protein BC831DRAFT_439680 [Entophlyctis helioformis]